VNLCWRRAEKRLVELLLKRQVENDSEKIHSTAAETSN